MDRQPDNVSAPAGEGPYDRVQCVIGQSDDGKGLAVYVLPLSGGEDPFPIGEVREHGGTGPLDGAFSIHSLVDRKGREIPGARGFLPEEDRGAVIRRMLAILRVLEWAERGEG